MMKLLPVLLVASALPLAAQWLSYRDPRTPRTADGRPNLTAPAPLLNGKPDLSGVWQAQRTSETEFARVLGPNIGKLQVDLNDITKEAADVFWGQKPEDQPLRPQALAIMKQRMGMDGPASRCLPASLPASIFVLHSR